MKSNTPTLPTTDIMQQSSSHSEASVTDGRIIHELVKDWDTDTEDEDSECDKENLEDDDNDDDDENSEAKKLSKLRLSFTFTGGMLRVRTFIFNFLLDPVGLTFT